MNFLFYFCSFIHIFSSLVTLLNKFVLLYGFDLFHLPSNRLNFFGDHCRLFGNYLLNWFGGFLYLFGSGLHHSLFRDLRNLFCNLGSGNFNFYLHLRLCGFFQWIAWCKRY